MKKLLLPLLLLTMATGSHAQTNMQPAMDLKAIKNVISQYAESIDKAHNTIGGNIFLQGETISFIHPKGYIKGWQNIKNNFYGMFEKGFSQRSLKIFDQDIEIYGDMAVAVFNWTFDATAKDGKTMQTKGRETQVYSRINGEWRIVHVHYSHAPKEHKN